MQDELAFRPDRRMGLIFHLTTLGFFALTGFAGLWLSNRASVGPAYLLYLLITLAAATAAPLIIYRIYALQTALYTLEREGIILRWGLRVETIPIDEVLWIHPAGELTVTLPRPWLFFPGALLAKRRIPGDGTVEYLASETGRLLYIATEQGGYAISPADPERFLLAYQRLTEMGSLVPAKSRSIYPAFLLLQVWTTLPARILLAACFALSLALFLWVSLSIPALSEVHLGFRVDGTPGDLVPAERLVLLPLLNFSFLLVGVLFGLFFFRREDSRPISYLIWSADILTALLFLLAVFFILQVG